MSRSLVVFIFKDHSHCKQLSGQDNLYLHDTNKHLKKNMLTIEQPPTMPRPTLSSFWRINELSTSNADHQDKIR